LDLQGNHQERNIFDVDFDKSCLEMLFGECLQDKSATPNQNELYFEMLVYYLTPPKVFVVEMRYNARRCSVLDVNATFREVFTL